MMFLVMCLAAFDVQVRIVLIDGDRFEPRNVERMFFLRGGNEARVVLLCDGLADDVGARGSEIDWAAERRVGLFSA